MRTNFKHFLWVFSLVAVSILASCSDDDPEVQVDKTQLAAKITEANTVLDASVEGTAEGQFQIGSKAGLEAAVDLAEQVNASEDVTQTAVDNATTALNQAIIDFQAKEVIAIEPDALVGHWTFDEGEGTSTIDFSGNERTGTLTTGHSNWGAGSPEWTSDRYGNAAKALHFGDGANVEIPYSTALNPENMTISLWVNADDEGDIWANNYMVSMNRWNGYKLQLQEANKAFMTVKADVDGAADPAYYDRDNESPELPRGSWLHVAVSFGGGEMTFYVNGQEIKKWDNTPGTAISIADAPVNLTIGQDLPTSTYSTDESSPYYVDWGGYFKGSLDEVRIYNKVLTATQIASIYDVEKVAE